MRVPTAGTLNTVTHRDTFVTFGCYTLKHLYTLVTPVTFETFIVTCRAPVQLIHLKH
jgi:hypothetical protein